MCGLAVYTHLDLTILINGVVSLQEGYAVLAHSCRRHLYCKLNIGVYRV